MSITDLSADSSVSAPPRRPWPGVPWLRLALVCSVLVGSGSVRSWQTRRVETRLEQGRISPFPLETLPMTLGSWRGEVATLDPQIARRTGATDSIFRRYVDQATGASVDVIVLYGPAADMFIHMPEVCYPAAGYDQTAGPDQRVIEHDGLKAPFRSLVFTKGEGGQADIQEVDYSWRYQGRWTPQIGTIKQFERIPGMYKVHLARRLVDQERRDVGNPCEALLGALVPEIERRLKPAT